MKLKDRYLMFMAPDDGGGDGGESEKSKGAAAFKEGGTPEKKVDEQKQEEPKAPTVDAAALAKQFGAELKTVLGERKEPDKEITPEEAKKLLKFFEIDDDFMKEFGDIATQKKALEKFRDGMLTHIHTVMGMRLNEVSGELEGKFKPAIEYVTKAEQRERDSDFDKSYPSLAKPELKPIIKAVQESIKDQKFENEKDHFKAVAEGVAAVIRVHNPEFKLTDGSSPSKKTDRPAGGLPVTTGGSGGGGGGKSNESDKPRGVKVFDK